MTFIDEIKKRLAAATQGKWKHTHSVDKRRSHVLNDADTPICWYGPEDIKAKKNFANHELIANAPTDIAFLLERIESADKAQVWWKNESEKHRVRAVSLEKENKAFRNSGQEMALCLAYIQTGGRATTDYINRVLKPWNDLYAPKKEEAHDHPGPQSPETDRRNSPPEP